MSEKILVVKSFAGHYDEEVRHRNYDINERSRLKCWLNGHDWVNGRLSWEGRILSESATEYLQYARFCSWCKLVSCFHYFSKDTTLEIVVDEFYSSTLIVGHCPRCNLNISLYTGCLERPDPRAWELITATIQELYPPPPISKGVIEETPGPRADVYNLTGYTGTTCAPSSTGFSLPSSYLPGGGWVSMPVTVSRILKMQGEEAAREYIKACLKDGNKAATRYCK